MNHNFYGSQFNMDDYMAAVWSRYGYSSDDFDNKKKSKKLKKELAKLAISRQIPLNVRVTPYGDWGFYRLRSYNVSINSSQLSRIEEFGFDKFLTMLTMLPPNSHSVHSSWIKSVIRNDCSLLKGVIDLSSTAYDLVKGFFDGTVTYDEVIKKFSFPKEELGNMGGWSQGKYSGGKMVGRLMPLYNLELYQEALKNFRKRFLKDATKIITPSIRKGSRINRGYVSGTDYRQLSNTSYEASVLKKVFVIVDSSGSMCGTIGDKATAFVGALVNSGVVDVTHVLLHAQDGYEDTISEIKKGNLFYYSGRGEGFQYLYDNTPPEWIKEADCVIIITDMNYDSYAEEGILEVSKKAKSSLVLSFGGSGTVGGFSVKQVSSIKEMSDAVLSIISK